MADDKSGTGPTYPLGVSRISVGSLLARSAGIVLAVGIAMGVKAFITKQGPWKPADAAGEQSVGPRADVEGARWRYTDLNEYVARRGFDVPMMVFRLEDRSTEAYWTEVEEGDVNNLATLTPEETDKLDGQKQRSVRVRLLATPAAAAEAAGSSKKHAFAWGRFAFEAADPAHLDRVKSILTK